MKDKPNRSGGMGDRGVTRPMSEQAMQMHDHGEPYSSHREKMLHMHHRQTLWVYWTLIIFGIWMLFFPLTFSYAKGTIEPSGGREIWLTFQQRIDFMTWSDMISGILLLVFGWRSLTPNRPVSLWICCFIGAWISMAPLFFWSPTAVGYLNNTMVGALTIALTVLVPGMPNMIRYMKMDGDMPPGWTYNPSSWPQRWIMIALALVGWIVSRYLGAFQLGFIDFVWDPFFGESSMLVLNSQMSQSVPISDGALGALAYTLEFLMGYMGSTARWRTMPWMVTFFGILVIPLGLVHIFLVISQPVTVGFWCTFCLLAAAIMLPMIPLELDEVIAMAQHMKQRIRKGDSFWQVFWKGGEPLSNTRDERSPEMIILPRKFGKVFHASIWGMSFPWTLTVSAMLGAGIVFLPVIFGLPKSISDILHLNGLLTIVVSVISMGEVMRAGRFLNILLGLAIAITPWFLNSDYITANFLSAIAGASLILLSFPKGPQKEHYGAWDKLIV